MDMMLSSVTDSHLIPVVITVVIFSDTVDISIPQRLCIKCRRSSEWSKSPVDCHVITIH